MLRFTLHRPSQNSAVSTCCHDGCDLRAAVSCAAWALNPGVGRCHRHHIRGWSKPRFHTYRAYPHCSNKSTFCAALGYKRNLMAHNVTPAYDTPAGTKPPQARSHRRPRSPCPPGVRHHVPPWRVHHRDAQPVRTRHGASGYRLRGDPGRAQRRTRPSSPARAVPAHGGALPPRQLPQGRLIQATAAGPRRPDQQGGDA